jgi:tRNA pseudouridine13 synthase
MADEDLQDSQPRKRARLTGPEAHPPVATTTTLPTGLETANGAAARNEKNVDAEIGKEVRAGITEYVSPENPGFSGILKQRLVEFYGAVAFTIQREMKLIIGCN